MTHVGRELELMVSGKKAMAAFCRFASENIDQTDGQDFEPLVRDGQVRAGRFFVKHPSGRQLVYTVYYRPEEEWRFALFKELKKSVTGGWNINKEAIEGILLDYDSQSIQEHIRLLQNRAENT